MTVQATAPEQPEGAAGLRRELRFWEAIAVSIAIMAPTAAMALNGVLPATLVGRAVPLAFIFATLGVVFVSYAFVKLTRYFSHAGSVYAFSGATLGPRAGFFAGWALMGTYIAFVAASTAEVGLFGVAFFQSTGIWDGAEWLLIALVAGVGIAVFAYGDIRAVTRGLLGLEGLSVSLIVILMIVIFVKLAGGDAPQGQGYTADIFKVPSGTSLDTVATAAVFGFLSFGGFDGAAAMGEETNDPRRNIPRAILGAVFISGGFYILCIIAQTLGFGTDSAGVKAFGSSSAPLGDLSKSYVGAGLQDAINLGAAISAFASALAAATAASRILFALGRDGFGARRLGEASRRTGAPAGALAVVMIAGLSVVIAQRIIGTSAVNAFLYPGTIGVLAMLVAYIVTNVGAIRFLFVLARRAPLWQIVVPIIAIAFLGYTIWKNIDGAVFPYDRFPFVVGIWLLVGLAITIVFPRLTRRIGAAMAREEGVAEGERS
jgi:amino acid transporter